MFGGVHYYKIITLSTKCGTGIIVYKITNILVVTDINKLK